MAVQVKISVRKNSFTGENIASANVVNLQSMDFSEFCDYLAQDSTVGAADVSAVMTQLEKKLPLLIGMGTKVQISQEGMVVKPTVSGSLTQSALKARLQAKKDAGENVDVSRELKPSDLTVGDLTANVSIDFSRKFKASFAQNATLKRTSVATVEEADNSSSSDGQGGGSSSATPGQGGSSSSSSSDGEDETLEV